MNKKGQLFPRNGTYKNKIAHDFSKAYNRKAKAVGSHCTFHGLRSYAISQMANAGVDPIDRRKISVHTDKDIHAGYTRNNLIRFKKAVDTIE